MATSLAIYSIKDLEVLSGIKAHTIRIWEKRYDLLKPERTETNIRYYQDDDVKLLLNAALLNRNGYKISRIASMSEAEISQAVLELSGDEVDPQVMSDALTLSMLEMDERKFNATMDQKISELGFREAMMQVVFPFLSRLSVLWMTGSVLPVQENFISGLIKQKLYLAIDSLKPGDEQKATFLLYLPEQEEQELSLLLIHYLLKYEGYKVINLGRNISLEDLKQACKISNPTHIFTIVNDALFKQSVKDYVESLCLYCRECTVLLTGIQITRQQIKSKKNCLTFDGLEEIQQYIQAGVPRNPG